MSESEKPAVPPVDGDALRAVALGFIADVIEYQFNRADDDTHGEVLERIEDRAREIATAHGYDGTRWPAMAEGQPSANPPQSQGRVTYLACPYSHDDRAVRVARFEAANRAASVLMRDGLRVFSPISHTHPIAEAGGLPLGWDFWEAFDRAYLAASDRVIVLRADGWDVSKGVAAEIRIAGEMGLPVSYIDPVPDNSLASRQQEEAHGAEAERGTDRALPAADDRDGVLRQAAESGDHHVDPAGGVVRGQSSGRREHGGPDGVRAAAGSPAVESGRAVPDAATGIDPAATQGRVVQRDAEAGALELASEGLSANARESATPAAPPAAEGAMRDALRVAEACFRGLCSHPVGRGCVERLTVEIQRLALAQPSADLGHRPQPPADPHPPADDRATPGKERGT